MSTRIETNQVSIPHPRSDSASPHQETPSGEYSGLNTLNLNHGLSTIRNLIYTRLHDDVEHYIGSDSMVISAELLAEKKAKIAIEGFLIAESAVYARSKNLLEESQRYAMWLAELRLGERFQESHLKSRLEYYLAQSDEQRRLAFMQTIERASPNARRAPLVLFRLIPLAARIVTAVAFGQILDANELRNQQVQFLPSIAYCHECHGKPLENGEKCKVCGNPIWSFQWLTTEI